MFNRTYISTKSTRLFATEQIEIVYTDFEKAFECVDHGLLTKLHRRKNKVKSKK